MGPEQQALPHSRSKQGMANVCKVDGSRQQSQEAAMIRRAQEANAVRVSTGSTGTLGAEIFQVQHCPIAALLYKPVSSEEIRL